MVATLNWLLNHWWIFIWMAIFGVFEGVRDFFIGIAEAISGLVLGHHERKMALAQARQAPAAEPGSKPLPGHCVHRRVKQVRDMDGNLVAWLCLKEGCEKQLPPDWAIAKEDLP